MTGSEFDDATLMAFADGELDPALAARVAAVVAQDPAAAARVALFRDTRAVLRAAAARPLDPLPDALMARVRATLGNAGTAMEKPAAVVPLAPNWPNRALALAASLALAIGAAGGFLLARGPGGPDGPGGGAAVPVLAALGAAEVAAALSAVPSGEVRAVTAGELVLVATFRAGTGETCREFTLTDAGGETVTAVSCHHGAGWDLRLAMVTDGAGVGYAPASAPAVLDTYLAATEAGAPLSPADEAAALADLTP